jgi:hypothetical protein
MIEVPYGRVPYPLDLGCTATVLELPTPPVLRDLPAMIEEDLAAPSRDRITVIVSDATRNEPRRLVLEALARHLPATRLTSAIATGTPPSPLPPINLALDLLRDAHLVHHDSDRATDLGGLGVTSLGTLIRVHRCSGEADLVIVTGCLPPHYVAGAGTQAISPGPGLCAVTAIRIDPALKTASHARERIAGGNPCREDLGEAVAMVAAQTFLLDGGSAADGALHAVGAGDLARAFRSAVERVRAWFHVPAPRAWFRVPAPRARFRVPAPRARFRVPAPRASLGIASDVLPSPASPYQAAKIATAVASLILDSGMLPLVAVCAAGISEVVNEAVFRIAVLPRLVLGVARALDVPGVLADDLVRRGRVAGEGSRRGGWAERTRLTLPRASHLLFEAST